MNMTRSSILAVAAGVFGGLLLLAATKASLFGTLFGLLFSPLPLLMTGLALGTSYLPLAVVGGTLAVAIMSGSIALGFVYLVVDAAPAAVITKLALTNGIGPHAKGGWSGSGPIPAWLAIAAVVLMGAGLATMPAANGLESTIRSRLEEILQGTGTLVDSSQRDQLMQSMAAMLPGAAMWNWSGRALISAVLAQWAVTRLNHNMRPAPSYRCMELPGWYMVGFWLAAIAAWVLPGDTGYMATNMAVALSLPVLLQGLAVIHTGTSRFESGGLWLALFYILFLLTFGLSFLVVVSLGVMDHLLRIRRRIDPQSWENE